MFEAGKRGIVLAGAIVLLAGCTSTTNQFCANPRLNNHFDQQLVLRDLAFLSSKELQGRKAGSQGAKQARYYIADRLAQQGAMPIHASQGETDSNSNPYFLPFKPPGFGYNRIGYNVVAWVPGTQYPEQSIVITAHYDHIGRIRGRVHPGADDNASGVAGLIALAGWIAQRPLRHSVVFLATDYEETGLYGAKAFVASPPVLLENVSLNLNLDMVGTPGRRNRLYLSGTRRNPQLEPLLGSVISQSGQCLELGNNGRRRSAYSKSTIDWDRASDHWAFARAGIPYLFLSVGEHQYYNTPNDTFENINPTFLVASIETALAILLVFDADMST